MAAKWESSSASRSAWASPVRRWRGGRSFRSRHSQELGDIDATLWRGWNGMCWQGGVREGSGLCHVVGFGREGLAAVHGVGQPAHCMSLPSVAATRPRVLYGALLATSRSAGVRQHGAVGIHGSDVAYVPHSVANDALPVIGSALDGCLRPGMSGNPRVGRGAGAQDYCRAPSRTRATPDLPVPSHQSYRGGAPSIMHTHYTV